VPLVKTNRQPTALTSHRTANGKHIMPYSNAIETLAHILEPMAARLRNQDITHQKTEHRYNTLSTREREQLIQWLQSHLRHPHTLQNQKNRPGAFIA
jgi:hypothetical protein